jgi:spectrin beta
VKEQLRQFKMTTTVATDYDNIEIQQQYSDVNNRWDVDDWDNENSSARLFERSRIKALAGESPFCPPQRPRMPCGLL